MQSSKLSQESQL